MGVNRIIGTPFLTRRQLLQRMGMVGGSSLALGAMNAWDLMAAPIAPRPDWQRSQQGTRVIILGAGVSGLALGYELGKLGYDYQILEARDRVGGLSWSVTRGMEHTELGPGGERQVCEFDDGQYINAGPWRIPNDHHGMLGYCKELGVRLERFVNDDTVMYAEDPALGPLAGRKLHLRELKSDLWGNTAELLAKALDQGSLDRGLSEEDKELVGRAREDVHGLVVESGEQTVLEDFELQVVENGRRGEVEEPQVGDRDLIACGDFKGAKAAGQVRQEGKGYVVQDGDVITIKFNV